MRTSALVTRFILYTITTTTSTTGPSTSDLGSRVSLLQRWL